MYAALRRQRVFFVPRGWAYEAIIFDTAEPALPCAVTIDFCKRVRVRVLCLVLGEMLTFLSLDPGSSPIPGRWR